MIAFRNELEWNPSSPCNTFPGLALLARPSKGWNYKGIGDQPQGTLAACGVLSSSVSQRKLVSCPGEFPRRCGQEDCAVLPFGEFTKASSELTSEQKGSIGKR